MGTLIYRGERYEGNIDPNTWPLKESLTIEQKMGCGIHELHPVGQLTALAWVSVRAKNPRLTWGAFLEGLTLADLDYEADNEDQDDEPEDEAPKGGDVAGESPSL